MWNRSLDFLAKGNCSYGPGDIARSRAMCFCSYCATLRSVEEPGSGEPNGEIKGVLLAFASMALAGAFGFAPEARVRLALVATLLGYGAFIEIVQSQIPGRTASLADLVADAFGIAAGLAAVAALRRWLPAPLRVD